MSDWTTIGPIDELPQGKATRKTVDGVDVLVARIGDQVFALGNRCPHQGAPLHRGVIRTGSPKTVTCPAHGSMFLLTDGRVMRGPATAPLPTYEVVIDDGMVAVRPSSGDAEVGRGH